MGYGAILTHAILIIAYAQSRGLVPRVTSTCPLYSRNGEDCISPYLGSRAGEDLRPLKVRSEESLFHLRVPRAISLGQASRILADHFQPTAIVRDQIEGRRFDLTVHYRGTDKVLEAAPAAFSEMDRAIEPYAGKRMFLATDEPAFEAHFRSRWGEAEVYNLGTPSTIARGRHFSDLAPEDKALEAVVNMFLLAQAPVCIRTSSYLSAMSKIINPSLRTVTINRAAKSLFPEREVLAEE
jgi:hypothetical protein